MAPEMTHNHEMWWGRLNEIVNAFTVRSASSLIAIVRGDIDTEKCQGHGRCAIIAPEVFDVDDLGKAKPLLDPCPEDSRALAEEAAISCPEIAITVS
jgi:ferredoxin